MSFFLNEWLIRIYDRHEHIDQKPVKPRHLFAVTRLALRPVGQQSWSTGQLLSFIVKRLEELPHFGFGEIQFVPFAARLFWLVIDVQHPQQPTRDPAVVRDVEVLHAPLDRMLVFVARPAGNVEEDSSQGVGDPCLGFFQTFDEFSIASARRSRVWRIVAQTVLAMTRGQVVACRLQTQVVSSARKKDFMHQKFLCPYRNCRAVTGSKQRQEDPLSVAGGFFQGIMIAAE